MAYLPPKIILKKLEDFVSEDIPFGDITADLVPDITVEGYIQAKNTGIVCGLSFVEILFKHNGIDILNKFDDGTKVIPSQKIMTFKGSSRIILVLERTALNILMRLSGIATMANRLVEKINDKQLPIKVAATRKTTPGFRYFEKYAVRIGGGDSHRFSLSDSILIKENHLNVFGQQAISQIIRQAKEKSSFTKKIEIEVENLDQLKQVVKLEPDIVLLDNFTPVMVKEAIKLVNNKKRDILIELSGGMTIDNIDDYLIPGVDVVSFGSITHSFTSVDFSLEINPTRSINLK